MRWMLVLGFAVAPCSAQPDSHPYGPCLDPAGRLEPNLCSAEDELCMGLPRRDGLCTRPCKTIDDCAESPFGQETARVRCWNPSLTDPNYFRTRCVLDCTDAPCPSGMTCSPTRYVGRDWDHTMICSWPYDPPE